MNDLFNLTNKNIVLTGAEGLIGKAISNHLENQCNNLIRVDIKRTSKNNFFCSDLSSEKDINSLIETITKQYVSIDVWINCHYPKNYHDWNSRPENFSNETFLAAFNDHVLSYYTCGRMAAERMKESKIAGSIINFSSVFGLLSPNFSIYENTNKFLNLAYPTLKGAITNMTKSLSTYYAPFDIRFNTISPGAIENNQPPNIRNYYISTTPLKRMAKPDDIAGTIVFLSSNASKFITGQNIIIDGGYSSI
ncbi:MAG: SDR family oxidoreductase [Oligoflexia bacterium]|nr:SDR family oxidoreductase [Oligoflexia bacterium]